MKSPVRTRNSDWGNRVRVGVDLSPEDQQQLPAGPAQAADLRIAVVTDGRTWERNVIHGGVNSCLSCGSRACLQARPPPACRSGWASLSCAPYFSPKPIRRDFARSMPCAPPKRTAG